MPILIFILVLIAFVFFGFVTLRSFKRFDAKVRYLYEFEHDRWEKIGKPTGFFWRPKEKIPFLRSFIARDALYFRFSDLKIGSNRGNPE
jgi:hypothetical protein